MSFANSMSFCTRQALVLLTVGLAAMFFGVVFQEYASSDSTMFIQEDIPREGSAIGDGTSSRKAGYAGEESHSNMFMLHISTATVLQPGQAHKPLVSESASPRFRILHALSGWKAGTFFRGITRFFDWSNVTQSPVDSRQADVVQSESTRSRPGKPETLSAAARRWARHCHNAIWSVMDVLDDRLYGHWHIK
jgi:hypothetical protein